MFYGTKNVRLFVDTLQHDFLIKMGEGLENIENMISSIDI